MRKASEVLAILEARFPNAACELNYHNLYQLIIAVVLSAQTTDKRVNIVTEPLFKKYPSVYDLANAEINDVKHIIASLGLYQTKARHIINLCQKIVSEFQGQVPDTLDTLTSLPGVGRKTANVVLSEGYKQPAIAVDTHVSRVAKRLGLTTSDDVYRIEMDLQNFFDRKDWSRAHHLLIHYGRYVCKAQNPDCSSCAFDCPERKINNKV